MIRLLAVAGTCAALALAACGGDDDDAPADPPTAPSSEQADGSEPGEDQAGDGKADGGAPANDGGRPGLEITTADSQFGEILFDADQRAIYLFDKETTAESECYGECAAAWPPVLTKGEPQATGSVEDKLLGTTERNDGTTQVTYDGRPLYYYVDEPAGQVLCHNVDEFGGLWLVLRASGEAVS